MSKIISTPAQTGVLLCGPGGLRINALQANLVCLTPEQQELVNKAKKYAMDQSFKNVTTKQVLTNMQQQQKSLQRHQALVLMCRVYVGSISFELREETLKAAFAAFGEIKSINLSWDPVTMKHKGYAFVEYELPEAAQLALDHMNGIQLGGRQIRVGRPSNIAQATPIIKQIEDECEEKNRIYISNVHPHLLDQEVADLFEPFGKVRSCRLAMTPNVDKPVHRGYGYIEFETEAAATEALTMDNFDLGGGQVLHACRATTPAEYVSSYGILDSEGAQAAATNPNTEEDIQLQLERANDEQETNGADNNGESPDSCNYKQKESTNGHENEVDKTISNIIVLKNMISQKDDLDDNLQVDVYEECSKYGQVSQVVIYVDKKPPPIIEDGAIEDPSEKKDRNDEVKIFLKYKDSVGSQRAREALNGRFFAGRKVLAEHYDRIKFRICDYSG